MIAARASTQSVQQYPRPGGARLVLGAFAGGVALLLLTALWYELLQHNWPRVQALCLLPGSAADSSPQTGSVNWDWTCLDHNVGAADPVRYWFYFRDYPRTFDDLKATRSLHDLIDRLATRFQKRPLYGPVSAMMGVLIFESTRMDFPDRMFIILALYAGLSSILLLRLLRLLGLTAVIAVPLAAITAVSYSWLSVFSVAESFSLSVVGLLLSMITGYQLLKANSRWILPRALVHCFVTGIACMLYPPNCGAILMVLGRREKLTHRLFMVVVCAALVLCLLVFPQVLYYGGLQPWLVGAQNWINLGKLADAATWAQVLGGFFFFSVVSPVGDFMTSSGGVNWQVVLARPTLVLLVSGLTILYVLLLRQLIRSPRRREVIGPALWLMLLVVWHVCFNPGEVLLFTSVPLGVLAFIAGCAVRDTQATKAGKTLVATALALSFLGLLALNWFPVFG